MTMLEAGEASLRIDDIASAESFFSKALKLPLDDKRRNITGNNC